MLAGTASHHRFVRAAALTGAAFLALTAASAERQFVPGLREAAGVVPVVQKGPNRWRGRARASEDRPGGGTKAVRRLVRIITRWLYCPPHFPLSLALTGRPFGVDAGSGCERRARWASLGGHGRNGAG